MAKRGAPTVGIYCRISSDRSDERVGVDRQEKLCRELCESRGWGVVDVYTDNDVSASTKKKRPEYERLLSDLQSGRISGVVAYHLDRLYRRNKDLERFLDVWEESGARDFSTVGGDFDLTNGDGIAFARILVTLAGKESSDKSRRIRASKEQTAKAGRANGGGVRPFGFEDDQETIIETEAAIIRELASRYLAGEGLYGLAKDLNERKVPTVKDSAWSQQTIRTILLNPRHAGLREHRGEIVGVAVWPPIITLEQHELIKAKLTARTRAPGDTARSYVLAGFLECKTCRQRMASHSATKNGKLVRSYRCAKRPGDTKACGSLYIRATPVEETVAKAIFATLVDRSKALTDRLSEDERSEAATLLMQLDQYRQQMDLLDDDYYVRRKIDQARFTKTERSIQAEIDKLETQLASKTVSRAIGSVPLDQQGFDLAWKERDIKWKRALVDALILKIEVSPALRRGPNQDFKQRMNILWR